MILFPAIDILEGRAVRLYKGDKNKVTDYGDPVAFAEKWAEAGAGWLHVVDLSGAFSGKSGIDGVISEIKKRVNIRIQSGGGLRKVTDIRRRLDAGADRAVIGTMAVSDPDEFALAAYSFPEKIVAGIDARGGMLAVKGWTETTDISAAAFGKKMRAHGHPLGAVHRYFQRRRHAGRQPLRNGAHAEGNGAERHRLGRRFLPERYRKSQRQRRRRLRSGQVCLRRRRRSERSHTAVQVKLLPPSVTMPPARLRAEEVSLARKAHHSLPRYR